MAKDKLIVKSNKLIEAPYKLTVVEQKIMYKVISNIYKDDEDFKDYIFTVDEFIKDLGLKGQSMYSELKEILKKLRNRTFVIEEVAPKRTIITGWITTGVLENSKVIINIDKRLKPYLLQLKEGNITYMKYSCVTQFKGMHSAHIYELLKQYQGIKVRKFELDKLKEILLINEEYKQYGHFKQKVLLQSQKEINKKTDISFEFEEIKTGRKVTSIKFYISENKKNITNMDKKINVINELGEEKNINKDKLNKLAEALIETDKNQIHIDDFELKKEQEQEQEKLIAQVKKIISEKLSNEDILKLLKVANNDINLIKSKYQISKTTGNIKNLVGWLIKAIKDNYKEPVTIPKENTFNNYSNQRDYNFEDLERKARERLIKKVNENKIKN